MVPTLACMVVFSAFGAWQAKTRGGKTVDILHYAASYAIFGLIVGVILTILLSRAV